MEMYKPRAREGGVLESHDDVAGTTTHKSNIRRDAMGVVNDTEAQAPMISDCWPPTRWLGPAVEDLRSFGGAQGQEPHKCGEAPDHGRSKGRMCLEAHNKSAPFICTSDPA
jgi:hypothetical protein